MRDFHSEIHIGKAISACLHIQLVARKISEADETPVLVVGYFSSPLPPSYVF